MKSTAGNENRYELIILCLFYCGSLVPCLVFFLVVGRWHIGPFDSSYFSQVTATNMTGWTDNSLYLALTRTLYKATCGNIWFPMKCHLIPFFIYLFIFFRFLLCNPPTYVSEQCFQSLTHLSAHLSLISCTTFPWLQAFSSLFPLSWVASSTSSQSFSFFLLSWGQCVSSW